MQPSNLQKDKADLTEWIAQLQDTAVIEELKLMMHAQQSQDDFTLTEEQIFILEEGAAKYESGEERSYSWEQVKHNAITSFYTLTDEQKNDIIERDRKHASGEEPGSAWEDVKKRILAKLDEKKA